MDVEGIDTELRHALAAQDRHLDMRPGRHRVLLAPSATADLMIDLYWAADARAAVDGHSVFSAGAGATKVGTALGGAATLFSDPHDPAPDMSCADFEISAASSGTSSPFDNGLPLPARNGSPTATWST